MVLRTSEAATEEQYSTADVIEWFEDAAPDDANARAMVSDVRVEWSGSNRIEVFEHLLRHGWAVTSLDDHSEHTVAWLNPIEVNE